MTKLPRTGRIFPGVLIRYKRKPQRPIGEGKITDQLHVNIWELEDRSFLDIGIKIRDYDDIESVIVDLPWDIEKKDIIDLGGKLSSEKSIAAIFNDVVSYCSHDESNFADVTIGGENRLILLRLNSSAFSEEKIAVDNGKPVSRIKITLPELLKASIDTIDTKNTKKNQKTLEKFAKSQQADCENNSTSSKTMFPGVERYIRFRIAQIPRNIYTTELEKKDKNILSSDIKTRIIDFRINVRRGIPDELLAAESGLVFPSFKKMHCFLTKVNREECHSQSSSYRGYRSLLDEDIWNEYISSELAYSKSDPRSNVSNYLGHQWTSTSDRDDTYVKDLIMMARFVSVESSYTHTIRFIILVIIFGAMGSGIWSEISATSFSENTKLIGWLALGSLAIIFIDKIINLIFLIIGKIIDCLKNMKRWF